MEKVGSRCMRIKGKINDALSGKGVFVIAEIGKNFIQSKEEKTVDEYLKNAKTLIRLAKEVGADAVKFQTHNVEDEQMDVHIVSQHFSGSDRYSWVRRNTEATPLRFWQELKRYSDELGIIFFSTPMSRGAAIILNEVGVPLWKVGSGDILDFVMLDYLCSTGKPIMISSGMSTLEEIDLMMDFIKQRNAEVILMHTVSQYPCPIEDLRLNTMKFFMKRYNVPVGFSDHSLGFESAVAAAYLGAVVVEKHFSISREIFGADHKVSMLPEEFKTMVKHIRSKTTFDVKNLGEETKILQKDELKFRPVFRKTLVYGQDVKSGAILGPEMVYAMRPQIYIDGLHSERYEVVIGKKVTKDVRKYEPIQAEDLV